MNKRIQVLKDWATKEVWRENQYNGAPEHDGYELDADMFAQLIVRQCVEVCLDRHDTWSWDDEPDSDSGPRDCAQSIKQHFGVES